MELTKYKYTKTKNVKCCQDFDFLGQDEFCADKPDKAVLIHACDKMSIWQGYRSFKRYFVKNEKKEIKPFS